MLQQALGLFADNTILADLRKQIERNFDILKTTLTPEKEHEEVCLSSQHAQWFVLLCLFLGCGILFLSGLIASLLL